MRFVSYQSRARYWLPALLAFTAWQGVAPAQNAPAPGPGAGLAPGSGMLPMPTSHPKAAVYIRDGMRIADKQYNPQQVGISVAAGALGISGSATDGVLLRSDRYDATGFVIANGRYTVGGGKTYYTVYSNPKDDYLGTTVSPASTASAIGAFNTVLLFDLKQTVPADAPIGSSAADVDGNAVLSFNRVYMQVDGAQRYVDSTYSSATTVVNDSYFVQTGNAGHHTDAIKGPFSNEALFISGTARANFSTGSSHTYYFNSTVVTEGWAALSTDASSGPGLDLYAYNTTAHALNGGYATYADFGCRVWLYGSRLSSAEVGAIISKSGQISLYDGASAEGSLLSHNTGKTTSAGSVLTGGRNALMIHAPDMFKGGISAVDYGQFSAKNSTLATDHDLVSAFDYGGYGDAAKKYVEYVSGDDILIKSTSARIDLDHTQLKSYSGVLVHSVLNSDRMSNYLAAGDNMKAAKDGAVSVRPISVNLTHMHAQGALLHDDYQRNMDIHLSATTLEGYVSQGTYATWKALWASKGVVKAYWLPNESWNGTNSLAVALDSHSSWKVTQPSTLSVLSIAQGAQVTGAAGKRAAMTVNGRATPIVAGKYSGTIVITPTT